MRHSELPDWLKPALPAVRHDWYVEYSEAEIKKILAMRRTLSRIDGLNVRVTVRIPGRCWSCGNRYQYGVLVQESGYEVDTVRHVRRGGCAYHGYSYSWESESGSFNPAVQTQDQLPVVLKLGVE